MISTALAADIPQHSSEAGSNDAKRADRWAKEADARRIWFFADVETESVLSLAMELRRLTATDLKEHQAIDIFLDSGGGSNVSMVSAVAAIEACPASIHITASGWVCSAAVAILVAGDIRRASPHMRFMVHSVWWGVEGHARDMEIRAAEATMTDEWYAGYLAARTKKPKRFWKARMKDAADHWFGAQEALEWGVVDEILQRTKKQD